MLTYLQLRVNDAQQQLLEQSIAAYGRSLQITHNRYEAGVAGRVDVAQAETQLKTVMQSIYTNSGEMPTIVSIFTYFIILYPANNLSKSY